MARGVWLDEVKEAAPGAGKCSAGRRLPGSWADEVKEAAPGTVSGWARWRQLVTSTGCRRFAPATYWVLTAGR